MTTSTTNSSGPLYGTFALSGRTAIVTGAGSGINLAFAELLLEAGCNVTIADISLRPESEALLNKYSSKRDGAARAVFAKTNVTIWTELENMFQVAEKEFGRLDIVCPGAGVFEPPWSNFWQPPGTSLSKDSPTGETSSGLGHYLTLDLNLTHPIRVTQMAMSRWLSPSSASASDRVSPDNPKRIIHISSIAGQMPSFLAPIYSVSKHGISSFIKSLAPLDQLGIRVNGVAPGIIRTPLWTDHPDKLRLTQEDHDTWVHPKEVAEAMLACLVEDRYAGGAIVEVTKSQRRMVELFNDPGPDMAALGGVDAQAAGAEVFNTLSQEGWGTAKQKR